VAAWSGPKEDQRAFRAICNLINTHLSDNFRELDQQVKQIHEEARDPLRRALRMRDEVDSISAAVSTRKNTTPGTRTEGYESEFNGQKYREVIAVNELDLDTVLYQSDRGLIVPGSKLLLPWGHGWTGIRSHSGGVLAQVNYMNSRMDRSQVPNWMPVSSMAVDYPMHGAGPRGPEYLQYRHMLDWRHKYFTGLIEKSNGLPLVPGTRSAENVPVAQLNLLYPNLFKAMIFMSPVHPTAGTTEGLQGYHHFNVSTDNVLYPKAFEMFQNLIAEVRTRRDAWSNVEHPFGNPPTPTLILVGSLDVETSQLTRDKFKEYAEKYPNAVYYVEIEGAGHNVFENKTPADKVRFLQAWNHVYTFLQRHGIN